MRRVFVAAAISGVLAALSASSRADGGLVKDTTYLHGAFDKIGFPGRQVDIDRPGISKIVQFADGKRDFIFITLDMHRMTFSASDRDPRPVEEGWWVPLATVQEAEKAPETANQGGCRYGDPRMGVAEIKCFAVVGSGQVIVDFYSDGRDPDHE